MPQAPTLAQWLATQTAQSHEVIAGMRQMPAVLLDLGPGNTTLAGLDLNNQTVFENHVNKQIQQAGPAGKAFAAGGYGEERIVYLRSQHFTNEEVRNIHLGVDLWFPAHTPVQAPLPGVVHSFAHNNAYADYGPTIILQHSWPGGHFYTLYGHLSLDSLAHVQVGQTVQAGQTLAHLGPYTENGSWPPHLHFQIMEKLEAGKTGDYPGVATKAMAPAYMQNCPNPNLLLNLAVLKSQA